jgi:hypothetical protein
VNWSCWRRLAKVVCQALAAVLTPRERVRIWLLFGVASNKASAWQNAQRELEASRWQGERARVTATAWARPAVGKLGGSRITRT